jgi:hypothetical protein
MFNVFPFDRMKLLEFLPQGNVCEIGVLKGDFSMNILEITKPKKLFLVDSWKHYSSGYVDSNNVSQKENDYRYEYTKKRFESFENVKIIRAESIYASLNFDNNFFDWIYIDANHSYKSVLNDLNLFDLKVKSFIVGHDWLVGKKDGFGVNEAVIDFILSKNYILSGITNESRFRTYVISKTINDHNYINDLILNFISENSQRMAPN